MVTRTKTVEFVTSTDVSVLTNNTNRDTSIDIWIPEGNPTFVSCTLRMYTTTYTTAAEIDNPVLGISDDNVTFDEVQLSDIPFDSGEQEFYFFERDVTSYFTTNFDGATPPTSVTWYVRFRNLDAITNNHSFKLILTYDYDDTSTTQIKTVRIPIESTVNELSTTYQTIGGATSIPALEGAYLPETSVTTRQIWLELYGPGGANTAHDVEVRVDATTETIIWDTVAISAYDAMLYSQLDIDGEDLSTAVALEARSSSSDSQTTLGGFVCATYEFNASTSTTILNSVLMPLPGNGDNGISATDKSRQTVTLNVQEPATLTLVESAVLLFSHIEDVTINVGSQATSAYPDSDTNTIGPQVGFVHRFDANADNGSWGGTFQRGDNDFDVEFYNSGGNATRVETYGYVVINYTSGKATDGVGAHNHTIHYHVLDSTNSETLVTDAVAIADPEYFINGVCAEVWAYIDAYAGPVLYSVMIERLSGEGGQNIESFHMPGYQFQSESSCLPFMADMTDIFLRFPEDPNAAEYLDIEASRKMGLHGRSGTVTDRNHILDYHITYHGIHYDFDVAVVNYTGDGSNIDYFILRNDTDRPVDSGLTATGGTASGIVYDNTLDYRCVAYQSLRAGASLTIAGSSF